jgi:anti-anti-sigma factor
MRISFEDHGETCLLAVAGDMLAENTDAFHRCVSERIESGTRNLLLEMTGLESIDSAGLELLLWTAEELANRSGRMKLVGVHGTVAEALRVTRMNSRFELAGSVEDAARGLR